MAGNKSFSRLVWEYLLTNLESIIFCRLSKIGPGKVPNSKRSLGALPALSIVIHIQLGKKMVSLLALVCVLQLSLIFKSGVMVPSWISSFGMEWMQAIIFQNFCRSNHVSSDQHPLDRGWNLPGLSGFFLNHYANSYQLNHVKRRRWGFWIHHQPSIIYLYTPMHFDCLKTSCGWFNPLTPLQPFSGAQTSSKPSWFLLVDSLFLA